MSKYRYSHSECCWPFLPIQTFQVIDAKLLKRLAVSLSRQQGWICLSPSFSTSRRSTTVVAVVPASLCVWLFIMVYLISSDNLRVGGPLMVTLTSSPNTRVHRIYSREHAPNGSDKNGSCCFKDCILRVLFPICNINAKARVLSPLTFWRQGRIHHWCPQVALTLSWLMSCCRQD